MVSFTCSRFYGRGGNGLNKTTTVSNNSFAQTFKALILTHEKKIVCSSANNITQVFLHSNNGQCIPTTNGNNDFFFPSLLFVWRNFLSYDPTQPLSLAGAALFVAAPESAQLAQDAFKERGGSICA